MAVLLEKRNLCGLVIDSVISEGHSMSANVTEESISSGASVADHMRYSNPDITMRVLFGSSVPKERAGQATTPSKLLQSNMPIVDDYNSQDLTQDIIDARANLLANAGITHFGSKGTTFDNNVAGDRIRAAWCRLIELMKNKEVCRLVTGLKVYDEVVVTSARVEQDISNCEKLDVVITLKQIKRVRAKQDTIRQINVGKGTKNKGPQNLECLRLNQVFSGGSTIRGSSDISISNNGSGALKTFSITDFTDEICGRISKRYVDRVISNSSENLIPIYYNQSSSNANAPSNIFTIYQPTPNGPDLSNPIDVTNSNLNIAQLSANRCRDFFTDAGGNIATCDITKVCGDSRFQEDSEEDEDKADTSKTLTREELELRERGLYADQVNQGVIFFPSITQEQVENENSEALFFETEARRLDCYYRETFKTLLNLDRTEGLRGIFTERDVFVSDANINL